MSERAYDVGAPSPGVRATVVPATLAVMTTAVAIPAAVLALLGTVLMTVGVQRGTRRLHTTGTVATFAGVLFAATAGAAPGLALLGGGATVLAWDAGEHAIGLGTQVGREAEARSGLLVHVGVTTLATIGVVLLTSVVFLFARTGDPSAAAAVLVAAVAVFALLTYR